MKWLSEIVKAPPIVQRDIVSPTLTQLLSVTIGASSHFRSGDHLPLGYHLLLFPNICEESELSDDGYTKEHAPGDLYKRRLWGAGSFQWRKPLIIGDNVQQSTKVVKAEIKGSNIYVHLEKIIYTDSVDDWSIKENRTMIYLKEQNIKIREGPVLREDLVPARIITPTSTLLFRYSALTFNAHKIHLDSGYTQNVEGFPELLVHGPLTCTLLLNLIHESKIKWNYPASFYYRAISPLFANRKMAMSIKWSTDQKFCKLYAVSSDSKTLGMIGTFSLSPLSSNLSS